MDDTTEFNVIEAFTDNDGVIHEYGSKLYLTSEQANVLSGKVEAATTTNPDESPSKMPTDEQLDQKSGDTVDQKEDDIDKDTAKAEMQPEIKETGWVNGHKV